MTVQSTTSFTDSDIRPDHLKQKQDALFERDIERLMLKKGKFVKVPCPACGEANSSALYQKMGQTYEICNKCETVFVNPRPTRDLLDEYYRTAEYYGFWNEFIFPQSESVRREKIVVPRVDRILDICERLGVATGTLLEIGAGFGTFCEEMSTRSEFQRIIALEPTPGLAESCRNRGLEVVQTPIEDADIPQGSVDVAVSFEVIEHLFSPGDFLGRCSRLIQPKGLLVLTCPNVKGFDIQVLGVMSGSVDPEHLNYFHPASLSMLVEQYGFRAVEVSTPGQLDAELVRKKVLAGEFDLGGQPFLRRVLIEDWDHLHSAFQGFLASAGLSSHMWLVAQKL